MKILTEDREIIRSSGLLNSEAKFTVSLTAKTVEVLSSQIYKDAHRAIVRELGTNAADSHVDAGKKDVPFDVIVPSFSYPTFTVRDYGTGMSDEKVMSLYSSYFASDKTDSNDVTGCLGLGSKSPFAYTDHFNVISWFNGKKSSYVVFKNEDGIPAINRMDVCESDEPQGVEVSVPIKNKDFAKFLFLAKDVYKWFSVKPKILAGTEVVDYKDVEVKPLFKTPDWFIFPKRYNSPAITIVMGNVAYFVDKSDIINDINLNLKPLLNLSPVLYVNIGEVEISASRETLKFENKKTAKCINGKLKKMLYDIECMLDHDISKCSTYFDACKISLKYEEIFGIKKKSLWNGKELIRSFRTYDPDSDPKVLYSRGYKIQFKTDRRGHIIPDRFSRTAVDTISIYENSYIFINDSKNSEARVKNFLTDKNKQSVLVAESFDIDKMLHSDSILINSYAEYDSYSLAGYILNEAEESPPDSKYIIGTVDQLLEKYNIAGSTIRTSTLPDKVRAKFTCRGEVSNILKIVYTEYVKKCYSVTTAFDVDISTGGVYLKYINKECLFNGQNVDISNISELSKLLGVEVFLIRKGLWKKFESSSNWIPFEKYLEKFYTKENEDIYSKANIDCSFDCIEFIQNFITSKCNKDSDIYDFVSLIHKVDKIKKSKKMFLLNKINLVTGYFTKFLKQDLQECLEKIYNCIIDKYPLISYVDNYGQSSGYRAKMFDYIDLVQKVKGLKDEKYIQLSNSIGFLKDMKDE